MNTTLKKRLSYVGAAVAALAAAALVTIGSTTALFSDSSNGGSNTFATGSVTVAERPASVVCSVTALMPGDSSASFGSGSGQLSTCDYRVKYTGSAPAFLAVDFTVGSGSPALFTGAATGAQFKVNVTGGASVMNGTTYRTQAGADTTVTAGTAVTNVLLSTTPAVTNDEITFTIDYLLPLTAPNALQGGSTSIALTFHAVQAANQSTGTCAAGRVCSAITWG